MASLLPQALTQYVKISAQLHVIEAQERHEIMRSHPKNRQLLKLDAAPQGDSSYVPHNAIGKNV